MVSIIIPVYNVEKYLRECIDCVINQTYRDLEIILVDDGSPDNCGAICDEYAEKDSRITVIHKKNGGLSDARNAGSDIAAGDYIYFLDSDDYIRPDAIETLVNTAEEYQSDIVCFTFRPVFDNEELASNSDIKPLIYNHLMTASVFSGEIALRKMTKELPFYPGVPFNFFRAAFYKENNFRFRTGLLYEDLLFTPLALLKAKTVKLINDSIYYYRVRDSSIMTKNPKLKNFYSYRYSLLCFNLEKKKYAPGSNAVKALDNLIKYTAIMCHNIFFRLSRRDQAKAIKKMSEIAAALYNVRTVDCKKLCLEYSFPRLHYIYRKTLWRLKPHNDRVH